MLATSPQDFAKCSDIVDTSSRSSHAISFDIEKQFIQLVTARTRLSNIRLIQPNRGLTRLQNLAIDPIVSESKQPNSSSFSMREIAQMLPQGDISEKDVDAIILRYKDQQGHVVILLRKTIDKRYSRIGSSRLSLLRAQATGLAWNQTFYIRARARPEDQIINDLTGLVISRIITQRCSSLCLAWDTISPILALQTLPTVKDKRCQIQNFFGFAS
jgi:hypothetical protein